MNAKAERTCDTRPLLSDLHLEVERIGVRTAADSDGDLYQFDFRAVADHLALLGDIGMTLDDRLFVWIRAQLARFNTVFYVPGNHEPYWSSLDDSLGRLSEFAASCQSAPTDPAHPLGQFVLLNRKRYDISPTLTVLGCTLWARLNPGDLDILRWSLSDFHRIDGFDPTTYQAAHARDAKWLEQSVEHIACNEPHRRIVIMTHHAPTVEGTSDPKFVDGPTGSAFATEFVGSKIWRSGVVKAWMFGHTHWCCDFERDGVRVVSNQRGYKDGAPGFVPDKVVEL
ncbi:Ser/Thr protein phosphatase superfamily protein [Trametes cingulata]|nr:Ser/Thr protein phosphatase superfamily protein [Trametes cingulata]